jgi:hypothetical protein
LPPGFDISFFARPTIEKAERVLVGGEEAQGRILAGREELCGDLLAGKRGADVFDVDADLASVGKAEKRQLMRVGKIEANRWRIRVGREFGLAVGIVREMHLLRREVEVVTQEGTEDAPRRDVMDPVLLSVESPGAVAFIARQGGIELSQPGRFRV